MKYKICGYIIAFFALTFVVSCVTAAVEMDSMSSSDDTVEEVSASPISVTLQSTYASAYYWRGANAGAGTGFMQSSADAAYKAGAIAIGVNVWHSQGIEEGKDNSETDYTVYLGTNLGALDISVGAINYIIPNGIPFAEDHVFEAMASVGISALPFNNSIGLYRNLIGDDDNSMYLSPSIGTSYKNVGIRLAAGISLGESKLYKTDEAALINVTPSISYTIPGDAETAVGLNLSYNPTTELKMAYITLGTSFDID